VTGKGERPLKTIEPFVGETQAVPAIGEKNLHECGWKPSTSFTIPSDWVSGVYLGRLTTIPPGDNEAA